MAERVGGVVVRGHLIRDDELRWRFSRSSGPGGQSVNTTDSRVELSYDLGSSRSLPSPLRERALERLSSRLVEGALTISAAEHRSQWRNRQSAMARLEAVLHEATAPPGPRRRATRPTRAARQRRLERKRARGALKAMRRRPPAE
jgi:ribosome-associated protein